MKGAKWIYLAVPIFIGVGMLLASQPKGKPLTAPQKIYFDDKARGNDGRPLTPEERATIERAIDGIGSPPPESLKVKINNRDTTVACKDIADSLRKQLRRPGGIEAEQGPIKKDEDATVKPDCTTSTAGDQTNISEDVLKKAGEDPDELEALEGLLVHEYVHKVQDRVTLRDRARAEKEADGAQSAYLDSIGLGDSELGGFIREEWRQNEEWEIDGSRRVYYIGPALAHKCYFRFDTTGGATGDSLITFELGDSFHYSYPFGPMRASDAMVFENHFLLPDSHCLGLVCGGMPSMNIARILLLDIYQGEVVASLDTLDFPGMFFYAMTHSYETRLYYFLDTLSQQILTMADMSADSIPETIVSIYASAFWPGFESLLNMRGVDAGAHKYHGAGLSVNHFDIHLGDCIYPYDTLLFLPDYDGNNTADACLLLPKYEFLIFTPVIQHPLPWQGDISVMLHATWDHDIAVWATDSLGQILFEELGMIHMVGGVDAECMLMRPLEADEFIVAMDMNTGERSQATEVRSAAPVECPPEGIMEGEPCPLDPDSYNGGCNSSPYVWSPIECYQTVCGTAWADTSIRDTDWYEITLTEPTHVTWKVVAEFPLMAAIITPAPDCSYFTYIYTIANPCDTAIVEQDCVAGTYWFFVAPSMWCDLPCSDYVATLECGPTPPENCMPCAEAIQMTGFVYDDSRTTCYWNDLQQNCLVGCHPWEFNCGGVQYLAGPKIFYRMNLSCQTTVDILCTPSPTMDAQLMVFTVCPTTGGNEDCESCVASSDSGSYPWDGMPERIITTIGPGTYYLSVDCFQNAGPNSCGSYDLHVTSADCPLALPSPSDQTIRYNPTSGDVELRWTDTGAPCYNIYRGTTDPYSGFTFLGSVPAGVGCYSDFAGANTKAFYYVTAAYDILQSAPNRPLQMKMNAKGEKKSFDILQSASHGPLQTKMKARRDDRSLLRRIQ